jgi:hypothetical protein
MKDSTYPTTRLIPDARTRKGDGVTLMFLRERSYANYGVRPFRRRLAHGRGRRSGQPPAPRWRSTCVDTARRRCATRNSTVLPM